MMFSISVTLHDIVHTDKSLTLVFEYLERDLKQYMDDCGAILAMNNVKLFLYQVRLSNILLYKIKCKRYFASLSSSLPFLISDSCHGLLVIIVTVIIIIYISITDVTRTGLLPLEEGPPQRSQATESSYQ